MSPHISPHTTLGSVFTFDRPSHFQQSHITSPTLSPASPSFLQGQIKQTGPPYQRHSELDNTEDPFLFPVDRDQPLFGGPFNQNHDTSLGDLRLRWTTLLSPMFVPHKQNRKVFNIIFGNMWKVSVFKVTRCVICRHVYRCNFFVDCKSQGPVCYLCEDFPDMTFLAYLICRCWRTMLLLLCKYGHL